MAKSVRELLIGEAHTEASARESARAALIYTVSADLQIAMEDQGLTRAALAKRLGISRSAVTQALKGRNLRLGTLADIAEALDLELSISIEPAGTTLERSVTPVIAPVTTIKDPDDSGWKPIDAAAREDARLVPATVRDNVIFTPDELWHQHAA